MSSTDNTRFIVIDIHEALESLTSWYAFDYVDICEITAQVLQGFLERNHLHYSTKTAFLDIHLLPILSVDLILHHDAMAIESIHAASMVYRDIIKNKLIEYGLAGEVNGFKEFNYCFYKLDLVMSKLVMEYLPY